LVKIFHELKLLVKWMKEINSNISVILASDENPIGKIIVTPGKEKD